jgi:type II secretory pathway pseudopilin PulG
MKRKISFNFTQQELYAITPFFWNAVSRFLPQFSVIFPFYTEGYVAEQLKKIEQARAIPNQVTRQDDKKTKGLSLDDALNDCLICYRTLKAYIARLYPTAELQKIKIEASGQKHYTKAASNNRAALGDLNDSAIQFLKNNAEDIKGKNIVPDSFLAQYEAAIEQYQTAQTEYVNAASEVKDLTTDNTDANNEIYQAMIQGIDEAKIVFAKDPAQSDYFSVSNFLSLMSGSSFAGLKGTITDEVTKKGVKDAQIWISGKDKPLTTDKYGKFDLGQLGSGTYTIRVTAEGYVEQTFAKYDIKTGVYNYLNVTLQAVTPIV